MKRIEIYAQTPARNPEDVPRTMTAGELIEYLSEFDENTPIFLTKSDCGISTFYGKIIAENIEEFDE